ncbi:MAG: pitrilysin family protein [Limnobacter sp.]|nr:pitrilysin family protein [Limnobacter sp.]
MFSNQVNRLLAGAMMLLGWATSAQAALPIQSWTTDSGAKVMFMQTEALPMLDIEVAFPAGDRADPGGKEGLATMTAVLLGTGTENLNEQAILDGFAQTGSQVSSSSREDFASISLRTLTSQPEMNQSIELLVEVLSKPKFESEVFLREQKRAISALKEKLVDPSELVSRAFSKAVYPEHPYGRLVTEESLRSLELGDVKQFFQTRYLGNHAVVSMVGNLTREQAEHLAEQLTSRLPLNTLPEQATGGVGFEQLQAEMTGDTVVIPHPAAQSHIMMGLPAMQRGSEDYFDLLVANHVLGGGGFTSRLMKEIREDRGLAYSTYSYFKPLGDAGPYQAAVQTKKEQTSQALKVMRDTLFTFMDNGPTAEELEAAKSNLIDGFPLRIDSNSDLVRNLTMMGFYSMPLDFLDTWPDHIAKVTRESAQQAFNRHVPRDKIATVVVGPERLAP